MNIYVACGLTHVPRGIFDRYVSFIHQIALSLRSISGVNTVKYALVDSDPQLATEKKDNQARLCYQWDRQMVEGANLIVADASYPSTGLGIELQIAEYGGIPIIMMFGDCGENRADPTEYENPDHSKHNLQIGDGIVSLMALGLPNIIKTIRYYNFDEGLSDLVQAVNIYNHKMEI